VTHAHAAETDRRHLEIDDIVHFCVANMPGAVPATSTRALTNATLPYVRKLADLGVEAALRADPGLALGLNVAGGEIVYALVAEAVTAEEVAA